MHRCSELPPGCLILRACNRPPAGRGVLSSLLLVLLLSGSLASGSAVQEGEILVLVYAAGGTLEADYGLITDDIIQMISGAGNVSPDLLEIVVAYGGADTPGWRGMTVANRSSLTADLGDDRLGTDPPCGRHYPDANMGNSSTLGRFLSQARDEYRYDRIFLILIGHGEAYTGMLFDQNHAGDPLTLPELVEALQTGGYNVELIGFDTCLMGSLEVAGRLSGYASYMIASEESEPAEGWEYDHFISYLAGQSGAPATGYAAALMNGYLQAPGTGRTLSLLDLSEAGVVTASLDRYSRDLLPLLSSDESFSRLRKAVNATRQFGLTGNGTLDPATMDLMDFVTRSREADPLLADPAADLMAAAEKMVLLSVHDDAGAGARGLAILSPVQINEHFYQYYREEASITPSWDRFIETYIRMAGRDAS